MHRLLRRPALWIGVCLAALLAVGLVVRARGPRVATVVAERRDLEQHVVASGRVMPPSRVNVSAMSPGLVVAVGAAEGQHATSARPNRRPRRSSRPCPWA